MLAKINNSKSANTRYQTDANQIRSSVKFSSQRKNSKRADALHSSIEVNLPYKLNVSNVDSKQ